MSNKKETTTVTLQTKVKELGQKASKQVFGRVNLSGYLSMLITDDCRKRNIK